MNRLELTDIFKSAYFLCSGATLNSIKVRNHGKPMATFIITGKDLGELDLKYRMGRALVNPLQLRESLNHLTHLRDFLSKKGLKRGFLACGKNFK